MRSALAVRDIAAVFRLLRPLGYSQRRIAALTGQSQSEVSEILGGRRVVSYDVLVRIAEGLGAPRGYLGLGVDAQGARLVAAGAHPPADGSVDVARASTMDVGRRIGWVGQGAWARLGPPPGPVPAQAWGRLVEAGAQLESVVDRFGGGACHEQVVTHIGRLRQVLAAAGGEMVAGLHALLVGAHLLAATTAVDVGDVALSRRQVDRAAEHARLADDQVLMVVCLLEQARHELWQGWYPAAGRVLDQAEQAADSAGDEVLVGCVHAHQAWAAAIAGDVGLMDKHLLQAATHAPTGVGSGAAGWWWGPAEYQCLHATALAALPGLTSSQRGEAIAAIGCALGLRNPCHVRARALDLIVLATLQADGPTPDAAIASLDEAAALTQSLRADQVSGRLLAVARQLAQHHDAALAHAAQITQRLATG
jgi:hypothetical protein